jgi:hypothetical protein
MRTCFAIALLLLAAGCGGPPPPAVYNDHLFDAVQTAITSRDQYWLEQYANRAAACRSTGQLTDEQYQCLNEAFKKAKAGDWAGAALQAETARRSSP